MYFSIMTSCPRYLSCRGEIGPLLSSVANNYSFKNWKLTAPVLDFTLLASPMMITFPEGSCGSKLAVRMSHIPAQFAWVLKGVRDRVSPRR